MGLQDYRRSPDGRGYRYSQDGWIYLHLEGSAKARGYQHGWLLAAEIAQNIAQEQAVAKLDYGLPWDFAKDYVRTQWRARIDPEYLDELSAMVDGLAAQGLHFDLDDMLVNNGFGELSEYWWNNVKDDYYQHLGTKPADQLAASESQSGAADKCSAFIATGSYTSDGGIVAAHNSFVPFELANHLNICIDLEPDQGQHFVMQALPGYLHSFTDFYESTSLIVLETTIGGFWPYDLDGIPEFQRIRKAVQYSEDIDGFTQVLLDGNNGGYANTWLVGELATGQIGQLELGLKFHTLSKSDDGYFVGFNAPQDPELRIYETKNSGYADIRRHQGARQVRLPQLMEAHKGQINLGVAKQIIADHYDVYLERENPSSRTVCSHYELDPRQYMSQSDRPLPFQPRGAVDGVCASTATAQAFSLLARFGSSCGSAFVVDDFIREHPQYSYLAPYLIDRPSRPWTLLKPRPQPASPVQATAATSVDGNV
jgi:hypothetical protein